MPHLRLVIEAEHDMITPLPCLKCGRALPAVMEDVTNQPHGGTVFTSPGQYGSTLFDPMNGEFLEVNICDECLEDAGEKQRVLSARNQKPVTHNGSRIGWARAKVTYMFWHKTLPGYEDDIEIDSWGEWETLRDEAGLTSWFTDGELREIFNFES